MEGKFTFALILAAASLIAISQSVFVVDQTQQALVTQLGQPVGDIRTPGLHFKIPLIQEVRKFDQRVLSVDPPPQQMVISSSSTASRKADDILKKEADAAKAKAENPDATDANDPNDETVAPPIDNVSAEPIIVDSYARYRIDDPLQFLKTLGTIDVANQRIENIVNEATRTVLGKTTLGELLSKDRAYVMSEIRQRLNDKIKQDKLGIAIVDVRIVRADLNPELRDSTVRRMISELTERATETRAKGEEAALEIRSTAEKERTVLLADAEKQAQILRGQGDKKAITIYTGAFNKDKEFYAFIRSMEAYKNTLGDPDTRLILSPDSEFFRYFGTQNGQ